MDTYVRSLLATETQSELFSQVPALILITKTIQKLLIAQLPISDRPECHYFRTGKCRYGEKCLFRHTDPTLVQAQSSSCNLSQDKPSAFQHSPYSLSNHKILNNEPRNMLQPKPGNKPEKAHHVQTEKEEATLTESHATPTERALNKLHTSSLYTKKEELSTSSLAAPRSPKQLQPTSTPSHPKPLDPLSLNAMFPSRPSNVKPPPPKRNFSSPNYLACLPDEVRRDRDNNSSERAEFDDPEGSEESSTTPWTSVKARRQRRGPPQRDEIEKAADETHRLCKDCGECFLLTANKKAWFESRGLQPPKRCSVCRDQLKLKHLQQTPQPPKVIIYQHAPAHTKSPSPAKHRPTTPSPSPSTPPQISLDTPKVSPASYSFPPLPRPYAQQNIKEDADSQESTKNTLWADEMSHSTVCSASSILTLPNSLDESISMANSILNPDTNPVNHFLAKEVFTQCCSQELISPNVKLKHTSFIFIQTFLKSYKAKLKYGPSCSSSMHSDPPDLQSTSSNASE